MMTRYNLGVFSTAWDSFSRKPSPFFAAAISANTTPVIAVAAVTRSPLKMEGSAEGSKTLNTVCARLASKSAVFQLTAR